MRILDDKKLSHIFLIFEKKNGNFFSIFQFLRSGFEKKYKKIILSSLLLRNFNWIT